MFSSRQNFIVIPTYPEYRVARVAQNNKHKSTQPWPLLRPPVGGPWRLQGMNTADRRMRPDGMGIEEGPDGGVWSNK